MIRISTGSGLTTTTGYEWRRYRCRSRFISHPSADPQELLRDPKSPYCNGLRYILVIEGMPIRAMKAVGTVYSTAEGRG